MAKHKRFKQAGVARQLRMQIKSDDARNKTHMGEVQLVVAAGFHGRDDLHVRMHLLPSLRSTLLALSVNLDPE